MFLDRKIDDLDKLMKAKRVLIIYGARRVGKTTLLQRYLSQCHYRYKLDSGDNIRTQQLLSSGDFTQILEYISGYELLAIDEAQEIPNIEKALKILVDHSPETRIIVTGSSSFDLARNLGEPLTGRKVVIELYPFAQLELLTKMNTYELRENLDDFLIFGSYPDVYLAADRMEKIEILNELFDSYLLKDALAHERIQSPKSLLQILKLLAFQAGNEVSLNELSRSVGIDVKTVDRYLYLLEESFVIKRIGGFSKNLRKEVTAKAKYYFIDSGVRNAVIAQFNKRENRNDIGALFESFIIMERMKRNSYNRFYGNSWFWRTYDGQEIDLVEEVDGILHAYEIKYSENKKARVPSLWRKHYPESTFTVINRQNYLDFIL